MKVVNNWPMPWPKKLPPASMIFSTTKESQMPDLPQKKVGIVACSGEEMAEGTVTRLAALRVLENLRPADTVTICLPLFLAGGEGDRAFARFYPTIAVDGCELRCAARATEKYSGVPAASIVVTDVVTEAGLGQPEGRRRLNEAGKQAVEATAAHMAFMVDELLDKRWSRRQGAFIEAAAVAAAQDTDPSGAPNGVPTESGDDSKIATCACGSGIPIQEVTVNGRPVTLIALPLLFEQFQQTGKGPSAAVAGELLEQVKIYNPVPGDQEMVYLEMIGREYARFCDQKEPLT
jgi:uncharacterized metal-binding protein